MKPTAPTAASPSTPSTRFFALDPLREVQRAGPQHEPQHVGTAITYRELGSDADKTAAKRTSVGLNRAGVPIEAIVYSDRDLTEADRAALAAFVAK